MSPHLLVTAEACSWLALSYLSIAAAVDNRLNLVQVLDERRGAHDCLKGEGAVTGDSVTAMKSNAKR